MRKTQNSKQKWETAGALLGPMQRYHRVNSKYEAKIKDMQIKEKQRATLRNMAALAGPIENQILVALDGAGLPEVISHLHHGMNFKLIQVIERDKATSECQANEAKKLPNVEIIWNDLIECVRKPFTVNCFSLDFTGSFGLHAKNNGKRICDILALILKNNQAFRWSFRINVTLDCRVNKETYEEVSSEIEKMITVHEFKIINHVYDDMYGKMCNRTYLIERIPINIMD